MEGFDNEIERAVNRAGRISFGLKVVAVVLVVLTLLALSGIGNGSVSYIGFGEALWGLLAAGTFYGLATLIHLNGMQLMETWRQGRRTDT
jgi:hypothetical protein